MLVNGIPMADVHSADLAGLVALVPQEPVILHASVMDNIRFYRDQISEDRVVATAQSIGIHDTIMALDQGYETLIGETTRGLSGGQRQRIAVAERSSAGRRSSFSMSRRQLSTAESERWVMGTLIEISDQSLALVIAHRQETIDKCNSILRFDDGRLVETVTNT